MLAKRTSLVPRRLALAATLLTLAAVPSAASAQVAPVSAGMETPSFSEFTQTHAVNASLGMTTERAYTGTHSALADYAGGNENAFARGIQYVDWRAGDDVWYGAAYYLPVGFKAAMQGEVALMRWDNWPTYGTPGPGDVGGLVIWGSDKKARLKVGTYSSESTLVGPFDFPEGRWVWAEVHQRFSPQDGSALTEVYLDDQKVGSSTRANMARPIERIRYGIVAIEGGRQTNPLKLWFDRATIATSRQGAVGGSPAPAPAPAPTPVANADRTPPKVDIYDPYEGRPFGNWLGIHASASDDRGIAKIAFFLDDRLIGTDVSPGWGWTLNTSSLPAGTHTITAKAYDAAGNVAVDRTTVKRVGTPTAPAAAAAARSHARSRAARRARSSCRTVKRTRFVRRHGHVRRVRKAVRLCGRKHAAKRRAPVSRSSKR